MRFGPLGFLLPAIFALPFILAIAPSAMAVTYYVSPSGDDSSAGTLATPFRTIQRAATKMVAEDKCLIRAGTYRETIKPANSGTSDAARITFTNVPGERVIISGCDVISSADITQHSGSIYKMPMNWILGKGYNQIFMNGIYQAEARFPNKADPGLEYPVTLNASVWPPRGNFHHASTPTTQITSNLLTGHAIDKWAGGLYAGTHYASYEYTVVGITGSGSGFLTVPTITPKSNGEPEFGRGHISCVLPALDVPGEWAWKTGFLYFQAPQGLDPAKITIEAKKRWYAFDLTGKSYITIRNLEVTGAGLYLWQASNCLVDSARLSYISEFKGDPMTTPDVGYGIYIGGHHNTVQNSVIAYSAGSAIHLTGLYHKITNNQIHDARDGDAVSPAIGIGPETRLENTQRPYAVPDPTDRGGHEVSYNTIYNTSRHAISISRDVGYSFMTGRGATPPVRWGLPTPYRKMLIHHNDLYYTNLLTMDSGIFYSNGTDGSGTEIHHNVVHDDLQAGLRSLGVYFDHYSFGFQVHHNILWGMRNPFGANEPGGKIVAEVPADVATWVPPDMTAAPYPQGTERHFYSNTVKRNYTGGVAGLQDADFPGGRFAFGAKLTLPVLSIERENSKPIAVNSEWIKVENKAGNLKFILPQTASFTLNIYDLTGRTLWKQSGKGSADWNFGKSMKNGVYFAKLTSGNTTANARVMVVR